MLTPGEYARQSQVLRVEKAATAAENSALGKQLTKAKQHRSSLQKQLKHLADNVRVWFDKL